MLAMYPNHHLMITKPGVSDGILVASIAAVGVPAWERWDTVITEIAVADAILQGILLELFWVKVSSDAPARQCYERNEFAPGGRIVLHYHWSKQYVHVLLTPTVHCVPGDDGALPWQSR